MSRDFRRTLVTAALPYANGPLHIGHIAGAYLPADIYCRYLRLLARDVLFICGSDEHGVPILLRAKQEGVAQQAVVDRYHAHMKKTFEAFGMSFDFYGRTSSPVHHETSRDFFRTLSRKNEFVLRSEAQRAKLVPAEPRRAPDKETTMSTETTPPTPAYAPAGAPIDYEDFAKIDLRAGVVLAAERVEKSKKLLRCQVDLGFEQRQILAGVAEKLKPEDLIGRRVVVVANLKPRKMMGLDSQGRLLMAETPDGGFAPLSAESPPGAVVK